MTLPRAALITPGVLMRSKKRAVLSANIFFCKFWMILTIFAGRCHPACLLLEWIFFFQPNWNIFLHAFKVEAGAWSIAEFLLQACCIVRCFNCAQFGQASKHAKLRKSIQGRCWYECTSLWWQDRADACSKAVLVAHKMWCLHQCINMSCH